MTEKEKLIEKFLVGCNRDFYYERNDFVFSIIEKDYEYSIVVMNLKKQTKDIVKTISLKDKRYSNRGAHYSEFVQECQMYLLNKSKYFNKR